MQISSLGSIRSCWIIIIRTHILYTTHSSDFTILKSRDSVLVLHELVCLGVTIVDGQLVLVGPAIGQLTAGVEVEGLHGDSDSPPHELDAFDNFGKGHFQLARKSPEGSLAPTAS